MTSALTRISLSQRVAPYVTGFDAGLTFAILLLCGAGLTAMYSAGFDHGTRFVDHARNMAIGGAILFIVAQIPPQRLMAFAVPLYSIGLTLLVATALFGVTRKGATRWLNIGVVIQPSEIMKMAMPLMLAWWFQRREGQLGRSEFIAAFFILMVPVLLIAKQPDLGTAILVFSAGFFVLFFAGLRWRWILPALLLGIAGAIALVIAEPTICQPDVPWPFIREYQKHRVCTLLDPSQDPLGKGFHIIQGMIAIGSGGLTGKGFMSGTQTHLEFIPERTTDFIFAAYAEEFGLAGCMFLIASFTFLLMRGLSIASEAPTLFTRLLAGSITLSFFTYAMVNMGMVSGFLPVVGVPLPFVSYGGTAMVTLGLGLGILMSIAKSYRLMQS